MSKAHKSARERRRARNRQCLRARFMARLNLSSPAHRSTERRIELEVEELIRMVKEEARNARVQDEGWGTPEEM